MRKKTRRKKKKEKKREEFGEDPPRHGGLSSTDLSVCIAPPVWHDTCCRGKSGDVDRQGIHCAVAVRRERQAKKNVGVPWSSVE